MTEDPECATKSWSCLAHPLSHTGYNRSTARRQSLLQLIKLIIPCLESFLRSDLPLLLFREATAHCAPGQARVGGLMVGLRRGEPS
jgi:hypothetical protein